jgi:hypothetical protein
MVALVSTSSIVVFKDTFVAADIPQGASNGSCLKASDFIP